MTTKEKFEKKDFIYKNFNEGIRFINREKGCIIEFDNTTKMVSIEGTYSHYSTKIPCTILKLIYEEMNELRWFDD